MIGLDRVSVLGIFVVILIVPSNAQQAGSSILSSEPFEDYDDNDKDYSHVGSLKFHMLEEKIPKLMTEVCMHNMDCPIPNCGLSLVDVVEATQLSRFNTTALVEAIAKLNIDGNDAYNIRLIYNLNPQLFEYFLQTFGFTFSDIYKNFVSSLATPSQSIPQILNALNVSVLDFMNAQAYGNDSVRLQVLSHGNYSKENINAVLTISNKTAIDMLKLIPLDVVARQIRKLTALEFTNFVKNLGVTSDSLNIFYKFLGITPINFLSYPLFIQVITAFYELLNPEEVLATLVSYSMLVTSNKARAISLYQNQSSVLVKEYSHFTYELVENPLVQYSIQSVKLLNPEYQSVDIAFLNVQNPIVTGYVDIPKDYNNVSLKNCTYVSKLPYGGLYIENVTNAYIENGKIVMPKSARTIYNLGSPLFCNETLYGCAIGDDVKNVQFLTFMGKKPLPGKPGPIVPPIIRPPLGNGTVGSNATRPTVPGKTNAASTLFAFNIVNIIVGFVIIKLTL